jgi:multisubunit Na+/H+ antiporter MnhG subunit
MFEVLLYKIVAFIAKCIGAIILLFGGLGLFNHLNGVDFKDVRERLEKDPKAEGDYYGRRILGVAIVIMGVLIGTF